VYDIFRCVCLCHLVLVASDEPFSTQPSDYEKLWHLIIPPVMTYLDDYEAFYKLRGIEMVSEMLKRVPRDQLGRTGVDGLLLSVGDSITVTVFLH
jgi:Tti2 family